LVSSQLLFVSGHLTDEPDRPKPRFPESQVGRVRAELREALEKWRVGPSWTIVTGGARGGDLLAAAEARALGAKVRLCLAMRSETFVRRSVRTEHPSPAVDWVGLFHEICADAQVDVLPARWQPRDPESSDAFTRTNDWMLSEIRADPRPHALLVWDGKGGVEGGTSKIVSSASTLTEGAKRCQIVDPTSRNYQVREESPGPKRILALDGGGIRGVIALEILLRMEKQLQQATGRPELRLAEYFDYIAGTSTGAIIATALALGKSVEDIRDRYHDLGHAAFRSSVGAWLKLARYSDRSVQEQLEGFLEDDDLILGDPRLETLLLIVMHSTETDSPWLLSNCTKAKYNRTERLLPQMKRDRNLDVPLLPLVRASTAAPSYFPPQAIQLGDREPVLYQDGGMTAFNNPALIAAVMATLPVYGLKWRKGVEDLLVVSVGTGSAAATARRRSTSIAQAITNFTKIVPVFMNGTAFSQDLLCRVMGNCRYGPKLDSEVDTLIGPQFLPDDPATPAAAVDLSSHAGDIPAVGEYFSYVRYDADLSDKGLAKVGLAEKHWKKVRQMSAVGQIKNMVKVGQHAANTVDVPRHFAGFLSRPAS
jgi:predicted acylesterase/phospholipase RssA